MKDFLNNLKRTVPGRARIMIFIVILIATCSIYFMLKLFSGDDTGKPEAAGEVSINRMVPSGSDISKPVPGEDIIVHKGSPMAKTVEEIEQSKIDKAKKANSRASGSSYVQSLKKRNQERNEDEANTFVDPNSHTSEVLLAQRRSQRQETQKRENALRDNSRRQRNADLQSKYMEDFLKSELQSMENTASSGNADIKKLAQRLKNISHKGKRQQYPFPKMEGLNKRLAKQQAQLQSTESPQNTDLVETVHVPAGERLYGLLETEVNTDEPTVVTLTILSEGPLNGALFIGEPKRVGESAVIDFNTFSLNGEDYGTKAIAFNEDTGSTRLADIVDRHIFERYSKLILATFVEGYSDALIETNTQSDGIFSNLTKSVPKPQDQFKVALGNVGKTFVPKFKQEFERPPTVKVHGNKGVGILLLKSVKVKLD